MQELKSSLFIFTSLTLVVQHIVLSVKGLFHLFLGVPVPSSERKTFTSCHPSGLRRSTKPGKKTLTLENQKKVFKRSGNFNSYPRRQGLSASRPGRKDDPGRSLTRSAPQ